MLRSPTIGANRGPMSVTRNNVRRMGSVVTFDRLFDDANAAAMVDLCERFGRYRMYIEHEQLDTDIGRGLSQRHDAVTNFLRTGGLSHADESPYTLAARTSYFREEYAYGQT